MTKPFLFPELARSIATHLSDRRRVVLVGPTGSGRTSVLREASRILELRGATVLRADARLGGALVSGQVLEQLGFLKRPHDRTPTSLLLAARDALRSDPTIVIAIDDYEHADPLSVQFLESLGAEASLLRTVQPTRAVRRVWPDLTFDVDPLDFEQVRALVTAELEAPASLSLVARILSKSGGNPELVLAIVGTARMEGLIVEEDGTWHLASASLWSNQLRPYAQRHVEGILPAEERLLRRCAQAVTTDPAPLGISDDDDALRSLVRRGLLRSAAGSPGRQTFSVWPPLLADLIQRDVPAGSGDAESPAGHSSSSKRASEEHAVIARIFQQDSETHAPRLLGEWEREPTPARAMSYLQKAAGTRFERPSIERVFAETAVGASDVPGLAFAIQRAQWTAFDEGDLTGAVEALELYAQGAPSQDRPVRAAVMLLRAFLERVPGDFREVLGDPAEDPTGLTGIAVATLELFSGNVTASRAALPRDAVIQQILVTVVPALLDALDGALATALARTAATREAALAERERSRYVGAGYADAFASMTAGYIPHVESAIRRSLSTAKATMILRPFFGATLGIAAVNAALTQGQSLTTTSLVEDAEAYVPRPGPLFGMGTDVATIIASVGDRPVEFDRAMAGAIRRRRELGYTAAAASVAILAGARYSGEHIAREVALIAPHVDLPVYARSLAAIVALSDDDPAALSAAIARPDRGDGALLAQVVGAAHRHAVRHGAAGVARRLEPIAKKLESSSDGTFRSLHMRGDPASVVGLTARETEVAVLTAHMKNSEIAAHLSISVRTVENHVANATRKIGVGGRAELAAAVAM